MLRYLQSHWPSHVLGLVFAALLLIFLIISASQGWLAAAFLSLALLILAVYFLAASLWSAHNIYDNQTIGRLINGIYQPDPAEIIVQIYVSSPSAAVWLSRKLTTGKVMAIDIYNPQVNPAKHLKRFRKGRCRPVSDPRLSWRDSDFTLLPLPDNSVTAVVLSETLSEFWQEGDRPILLREIYRILKPTGRLILLEQMRNTVNLLLKGPGYLALRPPEYWQELAANSSFVAGDMADHRELITCLLFLRPDHQIPEQYRLL